MCGIVGAKASQRDLTFIRNLILESQIRGKHATGVSAYKGQELFTIKKPLCAKEFIDRYWGLIIEEVGYEKEINIIAHTRYSTSGIDHNQPIADIECSVVMNGVITQSDPDNWMNEFNFDPVGTNDTEILHNALMMNSNPFDIKSHRTNPSMAVCYLMSGKVYAFRNGSRPGYIIYTDESIIVASTREIIKRAYRSSCREGYTGSIERIEPLKPGILYCLSLDSIHRMARIEDDLQRAVI